MKINWGTGLVIGMVLFIGFIMFFVVQIMTNKKYDYDLVTEDYYQKELVYQKELDALENSSHLEHNLSSKRTDEGWEITFPEELNVSEISGTVVMYRPSSKKLDFELPIQLSSPVLLIPDERMVGGKWITKVNWKYKGKDYLYNEEILY
ncbi:cytochrome C oxidase Cbb3 [Aequorivita sp. H23M31]|uniref:Cytochrome C oxidase Cbb3 n=1 Tax=Aequorivita ciconiae TaxID=2494375 RepID=A0A410G1U9_9FLAO|nr:FixH family protein [Aequorivita sp. H23M31]QAA81242.1 cytochrome C oxidase Cbb3 [Aequorivita sp. H23M31]